MPAANRKLRVFLCHASQDKPVVRELYNRLLAEGWIDPWLDEQKLLPGQDWDTEIEKAMSAAHAVIVCLSNSSVSKDGYIQKELRSVLDISKYKPEGKIFIIPIRLDDCTVPTRIAAFHYADFFPDIEKSKAFQKIHESLEDLRKKIDLEGNQSISDIGVQTTGIRDFIKDKSKVHNVLDLPSDVHESIRAKREVYVMGGISFIPIPQGKFIMGAWESDNQKIEDISYSLYISRHLVTNKQFSSFIVETNYKTVAEVKGGWISGKNRFSNEINWRYPRNYLSHTTAEFENHPVVQISWVDAIEYCKWLTRKLSRDLPTGWAITLPSEREWEKAARGENGLMWPWGNRFEPDNCNTLEGKSRKTTPVGQFSPRGDSPYGVSDMVGNVWEWTRSDSDFQRLAGGYLAARDKRSLRGGSFYYHFYNSNTTMRLIFETEHRMDDFGFRLALVPSVYYVERKLVDQSVTPKQTVQTPASSYPRPMPRPVGTRPAPAPLKKTGSEKTE